MDKQNERVLQYLKTHKTVNTETGEIYEGMFTWFNW